MRPDAARRRRSKVRMNLFRLRTNCVVTGFVAEAAAREGAVSAGPSEEYRRSKSSSLKVKPQSSWSIIIAFPPDEK
jgi:hypothetical protein